MEKDRLIKVAEMYENRLSGLGFGGVNRHDGGGYLEHISWMSSETKRLALDGKIEKANQWLGFIQGVLWSKGIYTIEQMKDHNRKK